MSQAKTKTDESIPEPTTERLEVVLSQLTSDQIRFVVSRQEHNTDRGAAEAKEISPNTVKNWKVKGVPIDEAVRLMALDGLVTALHVRKRSLAKAMMVKVGGLDSESEAARQKAATEIIEWEMGKAMQPTKVDGKVEVDLNVLTIIEHAGE